MNSPLSSRQGAVHYLESPFFMRNSGVGRFLLSLILNFYKKKKKAITVVISTIIAFD